MEVEQHIVEAADEGPLKGEAAAQPRAGSRAGWAAWLVWLFSMVFLATSLFIAYVGDPASFASDLWINLFGPPILIAYATVGAIIASRRPENPIGWIFSSAALLVALGTFAQDYARYAMLQHPGSLPAGLTVAWLTTWPLQIGFFLMFTFPLLLFPDGHLPSPRWRPFAWFTAVFLVFVAVLNAFKVGSVTPDLPIDNPLGSDAPDSLGKAVGDQLTALVIVGCGISIIVRFRGAHGEQRQQLKWFVDAAMLSVAQFLLIFLLGVFTIRMPDPAQNGLLILSVASFPVAAGIAIFKYRLYDIDLLINRTLVYVPLTAILAGVYSASIALFQKLFLAVTGEQSDAAIVITTLILASSFTPIKNGLQGAVDRRFKEVPDPTKKLQAFGEQVRSFVQLNSAEQLSQRLLTESASAFQATRGAVYLDRDGDPQQVCSLGDRDGEPYINVPLQGSRARLGEISLGPRQNGHPYTPQDRQTLQDLANTVAEALELKEAQKSGEAT